MPERYTLEDVPNWMIERGIGHIVAGPGLASGWARWACGTLTPCGHESIVKDVPPRICRKCRKVLDEYRREYLTKSNGKPI